MQVGDARDLDPITVEVTRHKLEGIANEMQSTLLRSSFSTVVKEGQDASASLFDIAGQTLAQACAVPIHLAALIPIVKRFIAEFPPATMRPGDIYIMNDPYLGGTHIPDIGMAMPVFVGGKPIALSASMTHHQDLGGKSPGTVPPDATEIFQEGLRIPPVALRRAGKVDETLMKMLRQNTRLPEIFTGDLNAQIAACTIGARRIGEVASALGDNLLAAIWADLLDRSEAMTRAALRAIPAGTYRYVDFLDNDGIELDRRIRIEVAVTIGDGTLHCDFAGSSRQVRGPFNCVPSGSHAAAYFAVRAMTDPTIPTNAGCFRPVSLTLPEDSIVNPREPAPVNARTSTIKRITGCILGALKDVIPERIPADSGGVLLSLKFGGRLPTGKAFVVGDIIGAGSGASIGLDGVDVVETDATNCMNTPVEAMELEAPMRCHRVALHRDSGGAGSHRGGLGVVKEFEALTDNVTVTHRGERHYCPAAGAQGGMAGGTSRSVIHRQAGETIVPSKLRSVLNKGDRIVIATAGGGGSGAPADRPREAVAEDVRNGKVSPEAARDVYGLASA